MQWDLFFFIVFSAIAIWGAIAMLYTKEIVRSAIYLIIVFLMIGILYLFLNAEYLAIIQILVYVGAVPVLILFGIMLTKRRLLGGDRRE